MAALSLGAVVGIVVGGVVLIIFAGAIAVCIVGRGSRKRESKELKEMVIMRKKRSLRRPVWGERFEYSDNYDVKDIPPPRGSNEQQRQQYVESFAFDADALTTRQSYDRPYVSGQHQSDPQKTTTVGNYGQVSMISYGGPRTASNRVSSGDLGTLEDSWTQLIPKRKSYLSSRAPAALPTTKPSILYVHRPPSGHTSHPNTMQDRPDSFRSSFAVDLGAQHQKAWMMSSLEKEKSPYYR